VIADENIHEVAVIGIGLVGSATLRHLALRGVRCIGIGPAEPADLQTHTGRFASHYDSGRVTRVLDRRIQKSILSQRAIGEYERLGEASGIEFHHPVGVIHTAQDPMEFATLRGVAAQMNIAHSVLDASTPGDQRVTLPARVGAIVEGGAAGFIDPRAMLAAQLHVAQAHGAIVRRDEIDSIERSGDVWNMTTSSGQVLRAAGVVVSAGAHLDEMAGLDLGSLFDVTAETVVLATVDAAEIERLAGLPSIIGHVDDGSTEELYLVPPTRYPDGTVRLKLGSSLRDAHHLPDSSSRRAWMSGTGHAADLPRLQHILQTLLPGLRATGWATKPCLIADTPSALPVIDTIDTGLVIAAGCNGSTAKYADAVGALAAELLVEQRWGEPRLQASEFAVRASASATPAAAPDR
jgi:sarcosine oxidase